MRRRPDKSVLLIFGALLLIAVGGWLLFLWLRGLSYVLSRRPYVDVIYFGMGHTSTWWSVMCLLLGSGAAVLAAGLLLRLVLGAVRNPVVRIVVGALGAAACIAAGFYLWLICLFHVLAVGLEGSQTFVTADDGTTLMITQDGFDGDSVAFYRPRNGVEWIRLSERATLDPREGPCTVDAIGSSKLILTCGEQFQVLTRD